MKRVVFGGLLMMVAVAAQAKLSDFGHNTVEFSPASFADQRAVIISEMARGERYAELSEEQELEVVAALDAMAAMLQGVSSVDALSEPQKVTLFNLQETVNTLLTAAANDSRLVCRRETPVGTHRSVSVCKTVAERRRDTDMADRYLKDRRSRSGLLGKDKS